MYVYCRYQYQLSQFCSNIALIVGIACLHAYNIRCIRQGRGLYDSLCPVFISKLSLPYVNNSVLIMSVTSVVPDYLFHIMKSICI